MVKVYIYICVCVLSNVCVCVSLSLKLLSHYTTHYTQDLNIWRKSPDTVLGVWDMYRRRLPGDENGNDVFAVASASSSFLLLHPSVVSSFLGCFSMRILLLMPFNIIKIKELFLIKWKYRTNFILTITCSTIKLHSPIIKQCVVGWFHLKFLAY